MLHNACSTFAPRALVLAALAAGLAACAPDPAPLRPSPASEQRAIDLCEGACRDSVRLTYLGVSGFVVRHGEQAILTAPSFTHRGLFRLMLPSPFGMETDTALVDHHMGQVDLAGVSSILVGHAHYDHLLDVPYVARRWAPGARVYGSPTMANILAGDRRLRSRAWSIADSVGSAVAAGGWIYPPGGGMRFMPLRSSHAPNFRGYTFARGVLGTERRSLPRTARGWLEGEVYAYLIDLIAADSTPQLRIYYQDAAADSVYVMLPPFAGRDARHVDVAILCVGNYGDVPGNPDVLLGALRPRHVVLSHWEDFFRSPLDPLRVIPGTDTDRLATRLQEAVGDRWLTPTPLSRITIRY